jgi:hypothetical protein
MELVAPIAAHILDEHATRILHHAQALEHDADTLAQLLDWRTQWLDTTETPCGCDHASASSPAVPR